jgi:DNA polymerase
MSLSIDIETYSPVDLSRSGVYPYAEHPDFRILLFGYAFDDDPVQVCDLAQGEALPQEVIDALYDGAVTKTAWNALFERICINRHLDGLFLPPVPVEQWTCSMTEAGTSGLPMSLDRAAQALLPDMRKQAAGKALIRYFSMPCQPTKTNGGRTRNLPCHDPDKWQLFKNYNRLDVELERAIRRHPSVWRIGAAERDLYRLDQQINDRGIRIDADFVKQAIKIDTAFREKRLDEARALTGLENPNSVAQLKGYLADALGECPGGLNKETVGDLLDADTTDPRARQLLELRQQLSRTSVKKYAAMLPCIRRDGRAGGLFRFYGASRTGRWTGCLIQLHNLPRNRLPDLDLARRLVREGDADALELLFGDVPDTLSQLVRTAFIPAPGHAFTIADFSAIEARVIAWLAGEKWRLDVFGSHGKIYEASAARMFKVPVEEVTKGSPLRQKGKIAELALGYQGGANALITMGALKTGLAEDELPPLVEAWRLANPAIVRLWSAVQKAALLAVEERGNARINRSVLLRYRPGALCIDLPSGRSLAYVRPQITVNRFGSKSITYSGVDQTTKKWTAQETYGGRLVENIVQAIARDCLAVAMLRLDAAGYRTVMHVHDEVVIEHPDSADCLGDVCRILSEGVPWAEGLPLKADACTTKYYKKD